MDLTIHPTKLETSKAAATKGADILRNALSRKNYACVVLATGASQFDMLEALSKEPEIDWHRVVGFHLDEYVGIPISHPASFRNYLWNRFLRRLPLPLKQFHFIEPEPDPEGELTRLNALIRSHAIDLGFTGIGENAHLAFNDPPADFDTRDPYILVELDEACRRQQLGEGWFATLEDVPKVAISMSIHQIMQIESLICTVPEERKAIAVRNTLQGPVTPEVPASALQKHPACHLFLDEASGALR